MSVLAYAERLPWIGRYLDMMQVSLRDALLQPRDLPHLPALSELGLGLWLQWKNLLFFAEWHAGFTGGIVGLCLAGLALVLWQRRRLGDVGWTLLGGMALAAACYAESVMGPTGVSGVWPVRWAATVAAGTCAGAIAAAALWPALVGALWWAHRREVWDLAKAREATLAHFAALLPYFLVWGAFQLIVEFAWGALGGG